MPNYSTNLKTWGSTGQEFPDNYNYVEGEQPVDAWDNFFNSNVVNDIEHLITVTNTELLARDGSVDLQADLSDDQGNVIWDYSAGQIPSGSLEHNDITVNANDGLGGGGTVSTSGGSLGLNVNSSDIAGANLTADGSNNIELQSAISVSDIVANISAGGTQGLRVYDSTDTGLQLHTTSSNEPAISARVSGNNEWQAQLLFRNGRWDFENAPTIGGSVVLSTADEGSGNGLNADQVDGYDASDFAQSSVLDETVRAYNFVMN